MQLQYARIHVQDAAFYLLSTDFMKVHTLFFIFGAAVCCALLSSAHGTAEPSPPFSDALEDFEAPELPEELLLLLQESPEPPSLEEILGEEAELSVPPLPEELLLMLSEQASPAPAPLLEEVGKEERSLMPSEDISLFNHTFHVEQAGYSCSDCHNAIFQQARGAAKEAGELNKIAFSQGKSCGFCHDGTTAFAVAEENSCSRCHREDVKIPDVMIFEHPVHPVYYDHSLHLHLGFACIDCHDSLFQMKGGTAEQQPDFKMESVLQEKYCGSCHNGATAFALDSRCVLCHREMQGQEADKQWIFFSAVLPRG
jgi:c(7)-type cytochrome triheme protein